MRIVEEEVYLHHLPRKKRRRDCVTLARSGCQHKFPFRLRWTRDSLAFGASFRGEWLYWAITEECWPCRRKDKSTQWKWFMIFGRAYPSLVWLGTCDMLSHIFIMKQGGESLKGEMVRDTWKAKKEISAWKRYLVRTRNFNKRKYVSNSFSPTPNLSRRIWKGE